MNFELQPPFGFADSIKLGQSLRQIVKYLKSTFDYSLKIQHSATAPLEIDIKVVILELGLDLLFDPNLQLLTAINVVEVMKSSFTYAGTKFCSPSNLATFHTIYSLFGPTFPGKIMNKEYHLQYRGINFVFEIPEKFLPLKDLELPLVLPDKTSPNLKSFTLVAGEDRKFNVRETIVMPNMGIKMGNMSILIGNTTQDILVELGPPSDIMYKQDDKMGIHRIKSHHSLSLADYFWNYYDLGIDILMDGDKHVAKKIILHTNNLHHYEAMHYEKCYFKFGFYFN